MFGIIDFSALSIVQFFASRMHLFGQSGCMASHLFLNSWNYNINGSLDCRAECRGGVNDELVMTIQSSLFAVWAQHCMDGNHAFHIYIACQPNLVDHPSCGVSVVFTVPIAST